MIASAYVLINVEAGKAKQVYDALLEIEGTQSAEAVLGPYDIIALVQGTDFPNIGSKVLNQIQQIQGVERTLTCNIVSFEP
jgi:DNA-binding Lrp family transcriptional regulator